MAAQLIDDNNVLVFVDDAGFNFFLDDLGDWLGNIGLIFPVTGQVHVAVNFRMGP